MDNYEKYSLLESEKFSHSRTVFTVKNLTWCVLVLLFICTILITRDDEVVWDEADLVILNDTKVSPMFREFYKCVKPKLAPLKGQYENFWHDFVHLTLKCENLDVYNTLDIKQVKNQDEIKHVAFPKRVENLTMVTLGIGHDVDAEIELKKLYLYHIDFFGADPNSEVNKNLYEQDLGGKYYQYAVGDRSGMEDSLVLETNASYIHRKTQHIGIDSFFQDIVQQKRIDILWIDIESNEYPVLRQLHRNGVLDQEGVKICQLNVEFHKDLSDWNEMKFFHDFIWKVLSDRRYVFMKPVVLDWIPARYIRLFIVNVEDQECVDLYVR